MYISIDPDLGAHVDSTRSNECVNIKIGDSIGNLEFSLDGENLDEFRHLVATILSELVEEGLSMQHGRKVAAQISLPDPWLLALFVLMWEGLVQGLTWDSIKYLIQRTLSFFQKRGVAPRNIGDRETKLGFRIRWSGYLDIKELAAFFMRFELEFKRRTKEEREKLIPDRKKGKKKGK